MTDHPHGPPIGDVPRCLKCGEKCAQHLWSEEVVPGEWRQCEAWRCVACPPERDRGENRPPCSWGE